MRRIVVAVAIVGVVAVVMLRHGVSSRTIAPRHSPTVAHVDPQPAMPTSRTLDDKIDRALAADSIAQVLPMLYEQSDERQLETLYWLRTAPPERLVALMPRLASEADLTMAEKQQYALEVVDGFIADLEKAGVMAKRF